MLVAPEPCALTFSIQDVVSGEHDAAAHDVTFEAARTESVADPAAVKDLPVVCKRGENEKEAIGQLTLWKHVSVCSSAALSNLD